MTLFLIFCAIMMAAALVLIARPLLRGGGKPTPLFVVAVSLPLIALLIYWRVGHWTWEQDQAAAKMQLAQQHDAAATIARLEQRLREAPNDAEAQLNLGEALVAQDERALSGRAGELFESALALAPDNAKALWFGAINALANGKLPLARDRLARMLTQNPPPQIRSIIERQIQDIEQQLGEQATAQSNAKSRVLDVQVTIAPALAKDIDKSTPLFVLARDPSQPGPPLAVVRKTAGDLPLSIKLSDNDAMMRGRGISSVSRAQVVARISKTGTPQAQPGDLFGDADVQLRDGQPIAVKIVINQKVDRKVE